MTERRQQTLLNLFATAGTVILAGSSGYACGLGDPAWPVYIVCAVVYAVAQAMLGAWR